METKKASFYLLMGVVALLAVLVGFFTTYILPSLMGSFQAPGVVHMHGLFAFAWVVVFLAQTLLVKFRDLRTHRRLGYLSLLIAAGIVLTMLPTGLFQVNRDLSIGLGETAISQIVSIITTGIMFAGLVAAGYVYRKKPKIHKRLLLLATILLIWPAWFRFRHYFPAVPRPDIWFAVVLADSLILMA